VKVGKLHRVKKKIPGERGRQGFRAETQGFTVPKNAQMGRSETGLKKSKNQEETEATRGKALSISKAKKKNARVRRVKNGEQRRKVGIL